MQRKRVFCLTHAYTAYPMIRQARAMVAAGMLGELRAVQVEYLQAGMSRRVEDGPLTAKLRWKLDTAQSGPSLVLGDIGTHAEHLRALRRRPAHHRHRRRSRRAGAGARRCTTGVGACCAWRAACAAR